MLLLPLFTLLMSSSISCCLSLSLRVRVMAFSATFNNTSVISQRPVLLVEETGVPGENTTDLSKVPDKLYHMMLHRVHLTFAGFELITLVVIGHDCIGSNKSNYHIITTTTAPDYPFDIFKHFLLITIKCFKIVNNLSYPRRLQFNLIIYNSNY